MSSTRTGYVSPWSHEFREGVECLYCKNSERVVLCGSEGSQVGVCEACSVIAHYLWRELAPGFEPVGRAGDPSVVKVLVPRLSRLPDGRQATPAHPASYEFLFDLRGAEGERADLPSAPVALEGGGREAVLRVMGELGLVTWPSCVEPLYRGHTYRGGMAEVYLVTAYGEVPGAPKSSRLAWRAWPVSDHSAEAQAGFYSALEHVFPLRLGNYLADARRTSELGTYLRRGAVEYVGMQLALLADPGVDTSMAEYLRKTMTEDERLVCKAIVSSAKIDAEKAEADAALAVQQAEKSVESGEALAPESDDLPDELPGGEAGSLEDAFGEGSSDE